MKISKATFTAIHKRLEKVEEDANRVERGRFYDLILANQEKDGSFSAMCLRSDGKRIEQTFAIKQELDAFLEDEQYVTAIINTGLED